MAWKLEGEIPGIGNSPRQKKGKVVCPCVVYDMWLRGLIHCDEDCNSLVDVPRKGVEEFAFSWDGSVVCCET